MNIIVFLSLALLLLAGAHYYLWRRLVRDTTERGTVPRRIGTALAVLMPLMSVAAMVTTRALPPAIARFFAWPGYMWLALLLYLLLALLLCELARPLLIRRPRRRVASSDRCLRTRAPGLVPVGTRSEGTRSVDTGPEGGAVPGNTSGTEGTAPNGGPTQGGRDEVGQERGAQEREEVGTTEASRRLFVARSLALAAGAAATATVGYGTAVALGPPELKRVTVPLAKLAKRDHGLRIAVVSDIHLGPLLGRAHTQRIVDTINRTRPDVVAIVGDLVDGDVEELGSAAEPLARLRATHGSYFVTGNHEYFSGAQQWLDELRTLNVRPLENERVEIAGFDLAGVNDLNGEDEGQGPDFESALGDRDLAKASVLLAHQPVQVHDAVRYKVDLQLSGHTHGGQLWPGTLLAALPNPTVAGLERFGDTQLYVTRGAGFWGPPVRVGAPPDITVVELASPRA